MTFPTEWKVIKFNGSKPPTRRESKRMCSQLVGGAITILKNMSSSMGRMTSHI
jgi:hypothetical protein